MSIVGKLLHTYGFIVNHPLNQQHKQAALRKGLKWQLATRLLGMKVIVPWVDEAKFIVGGGDTGLTGNLYGGFMEYEDMLFLLHALQPHEVFVDIGANVGAYSILASKVVGAQSLAFEPVPQTVEKLKDQIHVNRIEPMVQIKNLGVGDAPGALFFTNNNDTVNKVSAVGETANTTRVDVTTLDSELQPDGHYFLKIDVEGFEYNVLAGGSNVLASDAVSGIVIELNSSGEEFGHSNEEIHQKLVGFGFVPVSYDPVARKIQRLNSYNRNDANTLYVKNVDAMAERCRLAPRRTVHTAFGMQM